MPETSDPQTGRDLEAEAGRLTDLAQRATGGDAGALGELRKALDADPGWWDRTGDVAWQAQTRWLDAYAGRDEFTKEVVRRKMGALRRELRGPGCSPLERLLVERIVLTWLVLHYAEGLYAQRMAAPGGVPLDLSTHCQERIDRAQKRYLAAIKALATLRRLQQRGPLVAVGVAQVGQLNVAEKQVNVAAETGAPGVSSPPGAGTGAER